MKAIVQQAYGPADVLQLRDIDRPAINDDEVLIRVQAASNDRQTPARIGTYCAGRLISGSQRP